VVKPRGQNDFAYAHTLDTRLFAVLQQHAVDKPILVFCPTRKGTASRLLFTSTGTRHSLGTISTARQLAKEYEATMKSNQPLPWSIPVQCVTRHLTRQDFHRWLELIRLSMTKISLVSEHCTIGNTVTHTHHLQLWLLWESAYIMPDSPSTTGRPSKTCICVKYYECFWLRR
jgi:hypothetical protein